MLILAGIATPTGFTVRLIIAIALGLIVGLERQWTRHQAGILTNVIVCVGAYAYTAFSYITADSAVDKTRIAAQVVCGIGFLGAGLIIRDGTNIRGLSTAATIWATAAIGILCTVDDIFYSVIVAVAIVFLHLILHPLSSLIDKRRHYNKDKEKVRNIECLYKISISCIEDFEIDIRSHLIKTIRDKNDVLLHNLESIGADDDDNKIKIRAYITTVKRNDELVESIMASIARYEGIISAGWKINN
ncbi:MAG: MgtC/SapB family protein [Eubacterium sp.]|nr:MgtC/SapB family protein [Eubacterium sp.]